MNGKGFTSKVRVQQTDETFVGQNNLAIILQ
jgi:hypothetical protein